MFRGVDVEMGVAEALNRIRSKVQSFITLAVKTHEQFDEATLLLDSEQPIFRTDREDDLAVFIYPLGLISLRMENPDSFFMSLARKTMLEDHESGRLICIE